MAGKKNKKKTKVNAPSLTAHHEMLDELSMGVHAAMVGLGLANEDDPPPGCHWVIKITPAGVEKTLVCPIGSDE